MDKVIPLVSNNQYVLIMDVRDEAFIAAEQIKGLCDLMRCYQSDKPFTCLDEDNAILTGVKLIKKLATDISHIIDGAPGVGRPQ